MINRRSASFFHAVIACLIFLIPSAASASLVSVIQGDSPTQLINPVDSACTGTGNVTTPTGTTASYHSLSGPCAQTGFDLQGDLVTTIQTSSASVSYIVSNTTTQPSTAFSLEAFAKLSSTSTNANHALLSIDSPIGDSNKGLELMISYSGGTYYEECDTGSERLKTAITVDTNWHQWDCTLGSGTLTIYEDAVSKGSASATYTTSALGLYYGVDVEEFSWSWVGEMGIAAYTVSATWSQTQISNHYAASGLGGTSSCGKGTLLRGGGC